MIVYTLQIGSGSDKDILVLEHSETIGAENLNAAIEKAKHIVKGKLWGEDSNIVRLLEELAGDSKIVWPALMRDVKYN